MKKKLLSILLGCTLVLSSSVVAFAKPITNTQTTTKTETTKTQADTIDSSASIAKDLEEAKDVKAEVEGMEDAKISFHKISIKDANVLINEIANGGFPEKYDAVDIKIDGYQNGVSGKATISIPVSALNNVKDCKRIDVYRVEDSVLVSVARNVEVKDGVLTFETDHFTTYVFTEAAAVVSETPDTDSNGTNTGDVAPIAAMMIVMVLAASVGFMAYKKREA